VDRLASKITPHAVSIMEHFWPGGITIVFEAKRTLPKNLTAASGKIGIRVSGHRVASALVDALSSPITGTSANISGNAGCSHISNLDSLIVDNVDLILDAGKLKGGPGSTVIDATTAPPEILREGTVTAREVLKILDKT
jgi:L-threonylcarbamoyladenylate synthase